jgi:uncharacterized protein with ParB-like and HNH nuclease domain
MTTGPVITDVGTEPESREASMKAIDRPFTKIINGSTQFVIPVFQRDYRRTEAQCHQLWRDILHIAQDETARGHFIGSVVHVSTGDSSAGFTRWLLIDGQVLGRDEG